MSCPFVREVIHFPQFNYFINANISVITKELFLHTLFIARHYFKVKKKHRKNNVICY